MDAQSDFVKKKEIIIIIIVTKIAKVKYSYHKFALIIGKIRYKIFFEKEMYPNAQSFFKETFIRPMTLLGNFS